MDDFEEGKKDTSTTQVYIAKRAKFDQDKLEEGVRLIEKERFGLKAAARRVGVVKGVLQKYWNEHYKHIYHSEDDGSEDGASEDDGVECVPANAGLVSDPESEASDDDDEDDD